MSQSEKQNSLTKLKTSYFHHASSFEFVYKTLSQNFVELAAKYSDHQCYVFKSRYSLELILLRLNIYLVSN